VALAVELQLELAPQADEIDDEGADGVLTTELGTEQVMVADV
jgi:hypothetical protein